MKYENVDYPYDFSGFEDMTKKEAKQYFEWYMHVMGKRISYLENYICKSGKKIALDYSRNSLIQLWMWFEPQISIEKLPQEEYRKRLAETIEVFKDEVGEEDLSPQTLMLIEEIAVYYGETVRKCFPIDLHWDFVKKPKNHISINRPVLYGFNAPNPHLNFDPWLIVTNIAYKSLSKKNANWLVNVLDIWIKNYS